MTTDYYQTLGVQPTATPDEIKKAYRSLANKHHPDKGGDQDVFKNISVAYDTLGDANKKAEYDQQRAGGGQNRFNTGNTGFQDFNEMFGGGFDPFGHRSNPFQDIFGGRNRRNRDLNIQCQITLLDSLLGKQLEAKFKLPSGRDQVIVINVPAGVVNGDTIRYQGLGDDSMPSAPRGNLNVTIVVAPDPNFERRGDDMYTTVFVNPIEAMIGCRKRVTTLAGKTLDLEIRAGVEDGVEFAQGGAGFPNVNHNQRGRFVSVIKIKTPTITDANLVEQLKKLNDAISKIS